MVVISQHQQEKIQKITRKSLIRKINKRRNPEEQPQPKPSITCHLCEYKSTSNDNMVEHVRTSHSDSESNGSNTEQRTPNSQKDIPVFLSLEARKKNGFCIFWNRGYCHNFETCKFSHEESPACYFQAMCRRKRTGCIYFHEDMMYDQNFLDQRRVRNHKF